VSCPARKRAYREVLLDGRPAAQRAFLNVGPDTDATRLTARPGHFLAERLLDSQFGDLEVPRPPRDSPIVPADTTPEELVAAVIGRLDLAGPAGG
jgi:gluconokinase